MSALATRLQGRACTINILFSYKPSIMYQNHPSIRVNNDNEGYVFHSLEPSILCLLFVIITRVKLVLSRGYFERTAGSSVDI